MTMTVKQHVLAGILNWSYVIPRLVIPRAVVVVVAVSKTETSADVTALVSCCVFTFEVSDIIVCRIALVNAFKLSDVVVFIDPENECKCKNFSTVRSLTQ